MPTSSLNKRTKSFRVKMTPIEISSYLPDAGVVISGHQRMIIEKIIDQGQGRVSKVKTQTAPAGETNITVGVSPVHFIPQERRYKEDIDRIMETLPVTKDTITKSDQPNLLRWNRRENLAFMEHSTLFDNPALDDIDFVRKNMKNKRDMVIDQAMQIQIEKYMNRHRTQFSRPSNAQATPKFLQGTTRA